jgi:hypothetical protein
MDIAILNFFYLDLKVDMSILKLLFEVEKRISTLKFIF